MTLGLGPAPSEVNDKPRPVTAAARSLRDDITIFPPEGHPERDMGNRFPQERRRVSLNGIVTGGPKPRFLPP